VKPSSRYVPVLSKRFSMAGSRKYFTRSRQRAVIYLFCWIWKHTFHFLSATNT